MDSTVHWARLPRWLLPMAGLAFLAGLYLRFHDLGGAPLAVDEYFLGTSMLNTAQRWLPQFACGGYYTRGLLIQYLSLPLLWLGLPIEFTVRFWPAVASILTIVGVWRLGLLAGGRSVAAIAVILASLSLWEIEFGRFGRMYAPFQAIFVWYVYFQARHLLDGSERARWACLGLSAIAIVTYEGAAMLLALNFLPLVWRGKRWSSAHLAAAAGLLLIGFFYNAVNFRRLGTNSEPILPRMGHDSVQPPFRLPVAPEPFWPLLVVGAVLVIVLIWRHRSSLRLDHPSVIYWAASLAAFSLGFVTFGGALLAAGILMRLPAPLTPVPSARWRTAASMIALSGAWIAVVAMSAWAGGAAARPSVGLAVRYVLDYPDAYSYIVQPWLLTIPATALLLGIMAVPAVLSAVARRRGEGEAPVDALQYICAVLVLMAILVPLLRQPYGITRYTYFLYPLVLLVAAAGIGWVATRFFTTTWGQFAVVLATMAVLFALAEDFRIQHLLHLNEAPFRFRTAYTSRLAEHYYVRWDFRGAAQYVNERLAPDDSVIVFDQPLPHYLKRTSGIFIRYGTEIHSMVWACAGERDLWSSAPLLAFDQDVEQLIAATRGNVWLIIRSARYEWRDPLEARLESSHRAEHAFTSQDGYLAVYRIGAASRADPGSSDAPTRAP